MSASCLEVLMVRHAYADWVADEARPLSARGRQDAEELAQLVVRPSSGILPIDAIYSSPYPRAIQTVEPLAALLGLEIEIIDGLRERTLAEGAVDDFPAAMRASWEDLELSFPGGESSSEAVVRFAAAVESVAARHAGSTVAVATHGNVLGLWLQDNDPRYDYGFWSEMSWPDLYRLRFEDGRMVDVERLWEGGVVWPLDPA